MPSAEHLVDKNWLMINRAHVRFSFLYSATCFFLWPGHLWELLGTPCMAKRLHKVLGKGVQVV